jgi:hypothetical protein
VRRAGPPRCPTRGRLGKRTSQWRVEASSCGDSDHDLRPEQQKQCEDHQHQQRVGQYS